MQIGGPIAMIFLILFVLFMIYDVSTSDGAERKWQFYAVICSPEKKCFERTRRIPYTPPHACQRLGVLQVQKWLKDSPPTYTVKKLGCRVEHWSA